MIFVLYHPSLPLTEKAPKRCFAVSGDSLRRKRDPLIPSKQTKQPLIEGPVTVHSPFSSTICFAAASTGSTAVLICDTTFSETVCC